MPRVSLASFPLVALRGFEAAARLGSINAAAVELSVTPSAVSHQIKALEMHLGAVLFERLHRAVRLTPAGESLANAARAAFEGLDHALDTLAEAGLIAGETTLSVSAAPTFAAKWLAPRIDGFQSGHPRVVVRLRADDALTDPARDRKVDVAIRYGLGPYANRLRAERLWADGRVVAVCAPQLAAGLSEPGDLLRTRLLRTATPSGAGTAEAIGWAAWFAAAGVSGPEVERAIAAAPRVGTTQLALEAASAGRGVALSPLKLVEQDLALGRLHVPFQMALPDPYAFWVLCLAERADETPIRSFLNWLRGEVGA